MYTYNIYMYYNIIIHNIIIHYFNFSSILLMKILITLPHDLTPRSPGFTSHLFRYFILNCFQCGYFFGNLSETLYT